MTDTDHRSIRFCSGVLDHELTVGRKNALMTRFESCSHAEYAARAYRRFNLVCRRLRLGGYSREEKAPSPRPAAIANEPVAAYWGFGTGPAVPEIRSANGHFNSNLVASPASLLGCPFTPPNLIARRGALTATRSSLSSRLVQSCRNPPTSDVHSESIVYGPGPRPTSTTATRRFRAARNSGPKLILPETICRPFSGELVELIET
jgi:hypothetical protein